jgi:uncharacterized lipoprotein YmbA
MRTTTRLCLVAALCGIPGCMSLGRDSPPLEHYVLSRASTVDAPTAPAPAGVMLGMRRPALAAYLAAPLIVVRRGVHQIGTSEFHRWGEELGHGISHALASHLIATAPIGAVNIAPWPVRTEHAMLLQLQVSHFEGVTDSLAATTTGAAHVAVAWELLRPGSEAVLARGATDFRQADWRVGDYAALVTMLEQGLRGVALDIAACVGRLGAGTAAGEPLACRPAAPVNLPESES